MGKSNRSWIGSITGPEKRGVVDRQMNYSWGSKQIRSLRNRIALNYLKLRN